MENDTPQAVRNCRTCKQDLPEVEFRSVKDPTKFTTECANSVVAAMQKIASKPLPRRASKRTDSLANLTPPRRTAPTPASANALQPPSMPDLFRGLSSAGAFYPKRCTPIPEVTLSATPFVLSTSISQEWLPATPSLLPQGHCRGRYTRQVNINPRPRPQPQERQDLNLPALSEEDRALVQEFYTALNDDKMHSCIRCQEHRKKALDEPYFFSAANNLDFGEAIDIRAQPLYYTGAPYTGSHQRR
ncbi:hypothetical protein HRG_013143 [Hirsutella rhossiliensis]